nr:hypothetical protein [uncultured Steroidobacter sp.]
MSAPRKRASRHRPSANRAHKTVASDAPSGLLTLRATKSISVETVLHECVGAICLVEVTLHSLESQEIAFPEQEVLRRALKSIWSVHDWIDELKPDDTAGESAEREGES